MNIFLDVVLWSTWFFEFVVLQMFAELIVRPSIFRKFVTSTSPPPPPPRRGGGIPRPFDILPFLGSRPLRGWGIWHQASEGGEFDRSHASQTLAKKIDSADKILRSWPNGWPKMGRRNSGTLLNVSTKFLYPILIWKRPIGTYSILFWNDLAQLNGK